MILRYQDIASPAVAKAKVGRPQKSRRMCATHPDNKSINRKNAAGLRMTNDRLRE